MELRVFHEIACPEIPPFSGEARKRAPRVSSDERLKALFGSRRGKQRVGFARRPIADGTDSMRGDVEIAHGAGSASSDGMKSRASPSVR